MEETDNKRPNIEDIEMKTPPSTPKRPPSIITTKYPRQKEVRFGFQQPQSQTPLNFQDRSPNQKNNFEVTAIEEITVIQQPS